LLAGVVTVANAALPSYRQVRQAYRASDVRVLGRHGQVIERVRADFHGRRGDWVPLGRISPAMRKAVVLSEDHRFYSHSGVDWLAVAGAAWDDMVHGWHRGASTITMQLAGFIDDDLRRGPSGRTIAQKIEQAVVAQQMERHWTKPQILEAYLNLVPFRGEITGIGALSRVMFQKHASGLNARESALAAVLLRAPAASRNVLARRACRVLERMGKPEECRGLDDFIYVSLLHKSAPRADTHGVAPHFARWVVEQLHPAPGTSVATSIDAALQRYVNDSVERHLLTLEGSNVRDAAVVVLDNATGQILAYVGSSGYLSSARHYDHARALRQAGSTLKPFLYSQAIGQERLTAASLLFDGPLNLPTGTGLYVPQNYDKRYTGWVSVRTALASSLNIPAVRTLVMVTPDVFQRRLVNLGLPLEHSGDFYGYSLALGSADVTLLSLTNAYRALANLGLYSPVAYAPSANTAAQARQVIKPGAAWIVGDILSDRHARTRTFGLDSELTTPFWSAVKTGTSKDMRDNWCVGWSRRYTVGVWVGNSSGDSMRNVSGVSGAGPIWHDVMAYLNRGDSGAEPAMPAGVVRRRVVFDDGLEPARAEVFLGDTAMTRVTLSRNVIGRGAGGLQRILQPANGTILAVDPDIPAANQRTWFRAANLASQEARHVSWSVDGRFAGRGGEVSWLPRPGRHVVRLLDEQGKVIDHATVHVRGVPEN
jgi:penicillin-binding protein 1C